MSHTRRGPATTATTLATTVRDIRRTVRAADPAQAPSLAQLRETGWQLTQLTAELTDLIALLADHTGHHTTHPDQLRQADGEPATAHLARACRELGTLRHTFDAAHTAARAYYTEISQVSPTHTPTPRSP
ncbi:hypothetical protein [Actinokineospora sp. HUAS TT18]|uniref:hypothetical protein n=1 Tax=Actinokineospora sp. HUAS TT18 TaxID=3447451 RepID=UPI003F521AAE